MLRLLKLTFYALIILAVAFLYWFLPKYSYVSKNPGYCVNLTNHLYYCGNDAGLDKLFDK
ncbi:MAG TPA: hypothetical protein VHA30_01140 [Patescibacteria group bacterium]|nr:hypothetical protein [Patescibacteria group bacterium]